MDPGEAFLTGLITGQHDETGTAQNDDDGDNDPVDEDASLFSSTSLGDLEGSDIYGNGGAGPDDVSGTTATNKHSENEPVRSDLPILLDRFAQLPQNQTTDEINAEPSIPDTSTPQTNNGITQHDDEPNIPKGRSIANPEIRDEKIVFVSFDIETGGEYCGILQLSAEISRLELVPKTTAKGIVATGDTASSIQREPNTFNEYVNPGEGAIYGEHSTALHGLTATHPSIRDAEEIYPVWQRFCQWLRSNVSPDEAIVLVAYNGETCDLKWLWRMTQAPRSPLSMPSQIKYFLDPLRVNRY